MRLRWLLSLSVISFLLVGCGEEASSPVSQPAAGSGAKKYSKVEVKISPRNPASGVCLNAMVSGQPADKTVLWTLNGIMQQMGESTQFCLPEVVSGDVITVTVGDETAGATDSVTIGNSPPEILDTSIDLVTEGADTFIEIVPVIEDADDDPVSVAYQWLINGEPVEEFTGNRLPASAYQPGDSVKAVLVADDGTVETAPYETQEVEAPGAAPVIRSSPVTSFKTLDYQYQVVAEDPDGTILTFSLAEAPEGMHIDPASGLLTWSLRGVQAGEYEVVIVVTDADGDESRQEYTLNLGQPE